MKKYHSKLIGDDGNTYAEIWWDTDSEKVDGSNLSMFGQLAHVSGVDHESEDYPRVIPHVVKPHSWFHLHTVSKDDWK